MCHSSRYSTIALGMALSVAVISSATALEATAARKGAEANVANDIKLSAVASTLTQLYNDLKETVDDLVTDLAALTARVVTLEGKMTTAQNDINTLEANVNTIKTKQPVSWNTPLENRLDAIEGKNTDQDLDITKLKSTGKGKLYVTSTCSRILVGSTNGRKMMECPGNRVVTGLEQKGLATGSKQWSGYINCCEVEIR